MTGDLDRAVRLVVNDLLVRHQQAARDEDLPLREALFHTILAFEAAYPEVIQPILEPR